MHVWPANFGEGTAQERTARDYRIGGTLFRGTTDSSTVHRPENQPLLQPVVQSSNMIDHDAKLSILYSGGTIMRR